jgi:hypothetical protein
MNILEIYTFLVVVIIGGVLGSLPLLNDAAKAKRKRRFREQIKMGVSNETLTYSDMQHIAESWSQDRKAILDGLRIMLADAIAGEDDKLFPTIDKIRELIEEHQEIEPYAELPENVSLQLSHLQKLVADSESEKVGQLAASLSALYSSNQGDLSKQKKLTFFGVIFGVLGVVLGLISLYSSFVAS